jgi:hypothetical protein
LRRKFLLTIKLLIIQSCRSHYRLLCLSVNLSTRDPHSRSLLKIFFCVC